MAILVNTYKQSKNQLLQNDWTLDAYICDWPLAKR